MQILFEGRKKKSSESAEESDDKATGGDTEEATDGGEDTDAKDSEPTEEQGKNTNHHILLSICNIRHIFVLVIQLLALQVGALFVSH